MQSFITEENKELLETKLVDIMEDFSLKDNKALTIEQIKEENSLILVTSKSLQPVSEASSKKTHLPNWTISPYDLGGHSPYFCSQKIFSSPSSFYFLIISRYIFQ